MIRTSPSRTTARRRAERVSGYWRIEVYDGNTPVFERVIGQGKMTRRQIEATLRTLVAKHGLTDD